MPTGYITYINKNGYGFIDSPDLQLDYIYFHVTNCARKYKNIYKGDMVSFELDVTWDLKGTNERLYEAKNISFIQNLALEMLHYDYEHGITRQGFLKKIADKYYVKDRKTYVLIRLILTYYEINHQEVYEDKLNQLIDYKIILITPANKIRAINLNRQLLTTCIFLVEGNQTEGQVMTQVKGG